MAADRSPPRRRRTLALLAHYFRFNLAANVEYRVPFLIQVVGMIVNDAMFIIFWLVLFDQIGGDIRGYEFSDVMFLWSVMAAGVGGAGVLMANASFLSRIIYRGELDVYLLQPKPVLLNLLVSRSGVGAWGDMIYGALLFAFTQPLTPGSVALFVLFAVLAGCVFIALRVLYHSLTFFVGNAEQMAAVMSEQIVNFSLYPGSIFRGPATVVLHSLIPAALVAYLPAQVFAGFTAGSLDLRTLAIIVVGDGAVMAAAWAVFRLGLRRYESGNQIGARL